MSTIPVLVGRPQRRISGSAINVWQNQKRFCPTPVFITVNVLSFQFRVGGGLASPHCKPLVAGGDKPRLYAVEDVARKADDIRQTLIYRR